MKRGERSDVAIYVATHEPVFGGWADPYVGLLVGASGEDAAGSNVPPGFQLDSKGDSIAEKKIRRFASLRVCIGYGEMHRTP